MLGKGLQLKTTVLLVFFLWLVKALYGFSMVFQYGFRPSRSTADLLTVVSDRIARAFNRSRATQAVPLDIANAFDRVWHAGVLQKLKSCGISSQTFDLISFFFSNRWLQMESGSGWKVFTRISN